MDDTDTDTDTYAFLAVNGSATLRFDATAAEVAEIVAQVNENAADQPPDQVRQAMRELVRTGILDNDHLDPLKSQHLASAVVWLCITSGSYQVNPAGRGLMLEITRKADGSSNYRYAVAEDRGTVDDYTAKIRKGLKYVVSVSPEQAARAARRKKTPQPRDPSLDPPPRPRPERWMPALEAAEKLLGKPALAGARICLEQGALFVWRSRQIQDASQEELDASLGAMAQYDRLHLPFAHVLGETRDWMDVPVDDAPARRVHARFAIAAQELEGQIAYWAFADVEGDIRFSLLRSTLDMASLAGGRHRFDFERPSQAIADPRWNEAQDRRISTACGERLLELLFLLSCAGVARDKVQEGRGKPGKRQPGQRRMSSRDYTVIRVPLTYVADSKDSSEGSPGRWVRPHARRAHMWGVHTRTPETQHWRDACLVGAAKVEGGQEVVARPEYRVG